VTAQQTFRNTLVVIVTLVGAYAIAMSIRILVVVLVAIIIASAARPVILWLQERRIPQGLAITMVYGALLLFILGIGILVLPPAVQQLAGYLENEDRLATRVISAMDWTEFNVERTFGGDIELVDRQVVREEVNRQVNEFTSHFPNLAGELSAVLGELILAIVIGVYWLTARDEAVNFSTSLFSLGRRAMIAEIVHEIELSMGSYVRGISLVVAFVGIANFIILSLFRVPNAVTIAFIIGITTAIPVLGGFIGAAIGVLLALLSSPANGVITFLSFVAVQQVEVHYLTPRMMARSVGLNPILIIVFLFVGFALGGVVGAILSVPVAGTFYILLRYLVIEPRKEEAAPQLVQGGILIASRNSAEVPDTAVAPTLNK